MSLAKNLISGAIGAGVLNVVHEAGRKLIPEAPHVDIVAMRAIARILEHTGFAKPSVGTLRKAALVGDLVSNTFYYSVSVTRRNSSINKGSWKKAALYGLAAGVGAVVLPSRMGLGEDGTQRSPVTSMLTIAWYLSGSLAATAASRSMS